LARAAFDRTWTEGFVAWKYFDNPAGAAVGCCAEAGGQIVASFSNIPVQLKIGAEVVIAAQAVDAMVLSGFRRQRLFYKLARQTYQLMDARGIGPAYVFPAPAIHTAFVNQLGYVDVGSVPRYVKVINTGALAAAMGRGLARAGLDRLAWAATQLRRPTSRVVGQARAIQVSRVEHFDSRFDRLWRQASRDFSIATVRDAAYLTWRYRQNPQHDYLTLAACRGDDLVGYAILSIDSEHGIAHVVELIVAPADETAGQVLLAHLAELAQQAGCAQIQCWMLSHHRFYIALLECSGFAFRPGRLMPRWLRYITPFVVRVGPSHLRASDPPHLENWFISMGDHDYY
jgi:hypothetical protein